MVWLWNNTGKTNSKLKNGNKVLEKINNLEPSFTVLKKRREKNNYIYSLKSKDSKLNPRIRIKMKENYIEEFGWKIDFKEGKTYELEVVKYDSHNDWKLAITCIKENDKNTEYQVKIFTDRFEILTDENIVWNTWIIEGSMVSIIKAEKDIEWMWGFLSNKSNNKVDKFKNLRVANFLNLRGEDFYLLKWDIIRIENSYEDVKL